MEWESKRSPTVASMAATGGLGVTGAPGCTPKAPARLFLKPTSTTAAAATPTTPTTPATPASTPTPSTARVLVLMPVKMMSPFTLPWEPSPKPRQPKTHPNQLPLSSSPPGHLTQLLPPSTPLLHGLTWPSHQPPPPKSTRSMARQPTAGPLPPAPHLRKERWTPAQMPPRRSREMPALETLENEYCKSNCP